MTELTERDPTRNKLLCFVLAASGLVGGYQIPIINSMGNPILVGRYHLAEDERLSMLGNLNFFYSMGAMVGVLSVGVILDYFGRRKANILLDCVIVVSLLISLVESLLFLQLSRFMVGFSTCTINMVAGITMVEIFPQKLAGVGNTMIYSTVTFFLLMTFIQQAIFSYDTLVTYWRVFLTYPAIVSVVRAVLLIKCFEFDSPKDVMRIHGSSPHLRDELRICLQPIYRDEGIEDKVEELLEQHQAAGQEKPVSIFEVLQVRYRRVMKSGLFLNIGQQLSGINFLVFFSTELFDRISGNGKTISFVFGVGNFLGSFVCMYFVTRYTRLFNFKIGSGVQGLSLLIMFLLIKLEVYFLLPVFVFSYVLFFAVGLGATCGLYCNEILPPAGVGFCNAINWMVASLVGKLCPLGVLYLGSNFMIIFFSVWCFVIYLLIDHLCIDNMKSSSALEHQIEMETRVPLKQMT